MRTDTNEFLRAEDLNLVDMRTLVESQYTAGLNSAPLVEFLKVGRMPGQPGSIRNGVMPGFAYLPPEELDAIAAYVKAMHQ